MKYKRRRYREIVTVFAKHGFGLKRRFLHKGTAKENADEFDTDTAPLSGKASRGSRLRHALEELGPTFVKLGQLMSVQQDIFPEDIIEELGKLQDSVQPFSFSEVKSLIEKEFNDNFENIFAEFDETPIAAASVAQVHRARLLSGKKAAIKVQRPEIEKIIHIDLEILKGMARWIDRHTKHGKLYNFSGMVEDFESTISNELDFKKEGENADTFRKNLSQDEGVLIPQVRWIYTTKRVLTMEYIDGIKISNNDALDRAGIDRKKAAQRLSSSLFNQILRDGFFHADPHPGNIQVLPDSRIVFLDLGMVGHLSEAKKSAATDFFMGAVFRDSHMVVDAIADMGAITDQSNIKNFEKDVDVLITEYMTMPMNKIKLDEVLFKTFKIAYSNKIKIPREFALVAKALGVLQGLLENLCPELNSLAVAEPIAKKLIYRSFTSSNLSRDIKKSLLEYKHILGELPAAIRNILRKAKNDSFNIKFEMENMNIFQKRLERSFNRISLSVILLAVSIIIAGILISFGLSKNMSDEMYFFSTAVLKTGVVFAVIIVLGLIISMFRSRR